jgi:hypothetical protein
MVDALPSEAMRRLEIEVSWRQWALDCAFLNVANRGDLEAVFIEAEAILGWTLKKL